MKTRTLDSSVMIAMQIAALAAALFVAGCNRGATQSPAAATEKKRGPVDSLAVVLAPHAGETKTDAEIRQRQEQIRAGKQTDIALERLGWLFVAKARESFDPGFFKLAEQCALSLDSHGLRSSEALLLRGHTLQNLHRFKEAEPIARALIAQRGLSFDFGLLGDILTDLGRVEDATQAYQRMIDLKPDSHGYARAAQIRWLRGDLPGALELLRVAARGVSSHDPESAAWLHTRLAQYLWQSHAQDEAGRALQIALEFQTNFPPALLLQGRIFLASAKVKDAVQTLRLAAGLNPLPEYQWTLAEALRASQREDEAHLVEADLMKHGAATDPRTYSLYLATKHEHSDIALRLAQTELQDRADIFTHDALAWALAAAGKVGEAQNEMTRALAEGTQDARLYLHASVIAEKAGRLDEAKELACRAAALKALLLPSELEQLHSVNLSVLPHDRTVTASVASTLSPCGN